MQNLVIVKHLVPSHQLAEQIVYLLLGKVPLISQVKKRTTIAILHKDIDVIE